VLALLVVALAAQPSLVDVSADVTDGQTQQLNPGQVAEGLTLGEWASIREQMLATQYQVAGQGSSVAFVPDGLWAGGYETSEVVILRASDAQADDLFGESVSISGDTLVVGAPWEDGGYGDLFSYAGAAYVFERNQGGADAWGQVTKPTASDAQSGDRFGESISISGDTLVVGAAYEDGGDGDPLDMAGVAYVFSIPRCFVFLPLVHKNWLP
jgi:hypothetical protein